MKKLILAATALIFIAGAAFANQACFFGRNCRNGQIVRPAAEKTWKKDVWAKKMMMRKKMMMAEGKECPKMKEGGCPMMKHHKMMKGKHGKPGCKCKKAKEAEAKAGCGCKKKMQK